MKTRMFWLLFDIVILGSMWAGSIAVVYILINSHPDGILEINTNSKNELWPELIWMSIVVVLGFLRMIYLVMDKFFGGGLWKLLRHKSI